MELDLSQLVTHVLNGKKGTQEQRLKEAVEVYKQFSGKAEQTLTAPPSLEQREIEIKGNRLANEVAAEHQAELDALQRKNNRHYADVGNKAYGSRMGTYADTFNKMQAPTLAEMAAGRSMRDDTHRYLIDKNFENDAADRALRQQAINQQGRGQVHDLIKSLILGSAYFLS